ncbi:hypothetical protein T492DRAFT_126545 [Pavlovales sp. CCMP2436]|nr:hypothetical protein T492DRAFT_126545 [Pavlovales sp. CCMP2436]
MAGMSDRVRSGSSCSDAVESVTPPRVDWRGSGSDGELGGSSTRGSSNGEFGGSADLQNSSSSSGLCLTLLPPTGPGLPRAELKRPVLHDSASAKAQADLEQSSSGPCLTPLPPLPPPPPQVQTEPSAEEAHLATNECILRRISALYTGSAPKAAADPFSPRTARTPSVAGTPASTPVGTPCRLWPAPSPAPPEATPVGDFGLKRLCEQLGMACPWPRRKLTVLLVGNHSAGKSSFINWYLHCVLCVCVLGGGGS